MKATKIVIGALSVSMVVLTLLHLHINLTNPFRHTSMLPDDESSRAIVQLSNIIKVQNETITLLEGVLADKTKVSKFSEILLSGKEKDAEIASLMLQLQLLQREVDVKNSKIDIVSKSVQSETETANKADSLFKDNSTSFLIPEAWGIEKECSAKYGMELVSEWKKNKEIWCENESAKSDELPSSLICYPYHQAHKQLDGRGEDMFCEARNFFIDFSKVHGSDSGSKPMKGDQYLHFDPGSLSSTCTKTKQYREELFMPHHKLQMSSFQASTTAPLEGTYEVQETPTYLLARDEDCENAFHSTADFMNVFLVLSALGLNPKDHQVMLFDQHPDGPYMDLIQRAFSPSSSHPVIRQDHYKGKKVLFKRLIFHLESPAGLIFPKVSRPDPLRCYDSGLFQGYRKFVLHAFGLMNVPPPAIPTLTLTLRYRTPEKNVGRVLKNSVEVAAVLNSGNMLHVNVVDTAQMTFYDQLKLVRESNIIIGVHGAGLMFIMFAAEEAILVELHPSYRQDRHFRHAARMTGKIYMPLRSQQRETCVGSSDDVTVPLDEFRSVIDGAVRIARSFDDGLSECGLSCPLSILALDTRLDPLYSQQKMIKGAPLDTSFPCY